MKLTQRICDALGLPDGKHECFYWDDELPGFGLRLRRSSDGNTVLKSFTTKQYRVAGKKLRATFRYAVGVEKARKEAKDAVGKLLLRKDPKAEERERANKDKLTFRALVEIHLAVKKKKLRPRTYTETERYLTAKCYFGPLHAKPIDQIKLADVDPRIEAIESECGPAAAVRARAVLGHFFTWCMTKGHCTSNPTIGSEKPDTQSRDKVLTPAELVQIWKACGDDQYGKIVRLLILTACRRAEIGDMRWSELDERGWTIPASRAKTKQERTIPLVPMIADILADVPKRASRDQLFGERGHGFTAWWQGKAALDARSGVVGWVVHDIRRSVDTLMGEELAIEPHIVELVLGHEFRTPVQKVYNRARYSKPILQAYLRWHDYLQALIEGGEPKAEDNVVQMARR
jgi:integrase